MPRYLLLVEYNGNRYSGWQKQPDATTVEGEIEEAIGQILQQPVDIVGQGRTDSGVHAEGQAAHFDFPEELDRDRFLFALLGVLPKDIAAWDLREVPVDFHARFDAVYRQYRFQIATRPSPLWRPYSEMILEDLDLARMRECAGLVLGSHDFESFTVSDNAEDTGCTVERSVLEQKGHLLIYRVRANRFLQRMVRRLAGTIYQVGRGKLTVSDFKDLLEHPGTDSRVHGAAAKGLILEEVGYEKDQN